MSRTSQPKSNQSSAFLDCFHCGELVPEGSNYTATINNTIQPMCCPGCKAVAQLIAQSGLDTFYTQRTAYSERPSPDETEPSSHFELYDDPDINQSFTVEPRPGILHAQLLLGGITCAACTWLIEQTLSQLPGVKSSSVHLGQSRLDIEFSPEDIRLSEIFSRMERLGYKPRPFQTNTRREQQAGEYRTALKQLAVAGLGMMQVGMFAIALHAGDLQGIDTQYQSLLRWVSLLVASFVIVYSARGFFLSAWLHVKNGALVMDLPVSLAIGLAWLASLWATITGQGQVYFDSVVMFTFFLLLGRFMEKRAREKGEMVWLDAEATLPAAVKTWRNHQWTEVARQQLSPGETILITTGEIVPVDAVVTEGQTSTDESAFNGEHLPRQVGAGDTVFAGTLNMDGSVQARVSGTFVDTRLAALQRSLDQAQLDRPKIARLADQIASYFVAMVLLVTSCTAIVWYLLDPAQALWISLSVLVISCPCALALATPAALTGAANGLRRNGVVVRGENAIEALSRSTHLIFDKTGTLTQGNLRLTEIVLLGDITKDAVQILAASLQVHSTHPLASAFSGFPATLDFDPVEYRVASGVSGYSNGQEFRIGSREFCLQIAPTLPMPPHEHGYWIALCRDDQPLAWLGLQDTVREEAATVITGALKQGLHVELLTGDSSSQGPALARELGIATYHCGFSPQQKMAHVKSLQETGAVVTMVGDGLNDAPVLGLADASFAVAGATELARTQADFILLEGDLCAVNRTMASAKRTRKIIVQNLSWALGYNLCGIPLAALGYIPPWLAAIGMSASSLFVVLNSLRLNRKL